MDRQYGLQLEGRHDRRRSDVHLHAERIRAQCPRARRHYKCYVEGRGIEHRSFPSSHDCDGFGRGLGFGIARIARICVWGIDLARIWIWDIGPERV